MFGSRVCIKRSGVWRSKLDTHDFKDIFLGYFATDHNVIYLDLVSGIVIGSHHAQFDETGYLQLLWPPAAQLLYDLGVKPDTRVYSEVGLVTKDSVELEYWLPGMIDLIQVPRPPSAAPSPVKVVWKVPLSCTFHPLCHCIICLQMSQKPYPL